MTRFRGFMPAFLRNAFFLGRRRKAPSLALGSAHAPACSGNFPRMWTLWLAAVFLAALCSLAVVLDGCGSSTKTMQKKLEEVALEDLQDIIKEVPPTAKTSMLVKPYFKVDDFQEFHGDTAIVYQAKATLVFFYLDPSLDLCQVRKYRYKTSSGIWDRYDVKLVHFPKKYSG
jgi:hypothetical protein